MLPDEWSQSQAQVIHRIDALATPREPVLMDAASGIGRMLARGCAANGAHTILIDVNEQALCAVQNEVIKISSSTANSAQHSMYALRPSIEN